MTNLVTKTYIKSGTCLYTAWEQDSDHVGTDRICGAGQKWRPLGDRLIHTADEAIKLRKEAMDIIFDAFPELLEQKKIVGTSWIIAYEFSEEEKC
jgi:hypothetical protein